MEDNQENTEKKEGFGARLVGDFRFLFRVFYSAGDRFYTDNGFSRAASLAYSSLLSIFPLTTLLFALLAWSAKNSVNVEKVREFVFRQFVPSMQTVDKILQYLDYFASSLSQPGFQGAVLGFLLVSSLLLINSIEYALNEIWQVFEPRPILEKISVFCAIICVTPFLLFSAYYFTTLRLEPWLGYVGAAKLYQFFLPYLFDFVVFCALYYMVPKAPVRLRSAIFGALIATLLFGLAKSLFVVYIEEYASYQALYGAIAAVPIFLIWLYFAWIVVLFGCECCFQLQYLPREGSLWKRNVTSIGSAQLMLAVQSLTLIAESFIAGKEAPNELGLAQRLGCSTTILKPAIYALEKEGIVVRGRGRDMPLTLGRSPEKILLADVIGALFGKRSRFNFEIAGVQALGSLFVWYQDSNKFQNASLAMVIGSKGEGVV